MEKKIKSIISRYLPYHYSSQPAIRMPKRTSIPNKKDKTPFFFIDHKIFEEQIKRMEQNKITIAYSFKTNYHFGKLAKKNNLYIEVVSEKEYDEAKKLGFSKKTIFVNGPHKTKSLYKKAISNNDFLHLDSEEQIIDFRHVSKKYNFGLRFNPEVNESRFGLKKQNLINFIKKHKITRQIKSIHIHLGSNIDNLNTYKKAVSKTNTLIQELDKISVKLDYVDFGGGFPILSQHPPFGIDSWQPLPIKQYLYEIKKLNCSRIILEPGRFLVQEAVVFYTKVIKVQNESNNQIVVVDSTNNMLPLVNYQPNIIEVAKDRAKQSTIPTIIYGCSCQESDLLTREPILLPKLHKNELLCFRNVGAYNQSMSSNFIFNSPVTIFK